MLRHWVDQHPVGGWKGEYDEETLERTLLMQTELRTGAEENRRLTTALGTISAKRARDLTRRHEALTRLVPAQASLRR